MAGAAVLQTPVALDFQCAHGRLSCPFLGSSLLTIDGHSPLTGVSLGTGPPTIWLAGEQDIATDGALCQNLARAMAYNDPTVVVDLAQVAFLGASTSRLLILASEYLRGRSQRLIVRSPKPTGWTDAYSVRPSSSACYRLHRTKFHRPDLATRGTSAKPPTAQTVREVFTDMDEADERVSCQTVAKAPHLARLGVVEARAGLFRLGLPHRHGTDNPWAFDPTHADR